MYDCKTMPKINPQEVSNFRHSDEWAGWKLFSASSHDCYQVQQRRWEKALCYICPRKVGKKYINYVFSNLCDENYDIATLKTSDEHFILKEHLIHKGTSLYQSNPKPG